MEEKQNTGGKLTYIEELHRKRQNRKIRNTAALALVLAEQSMPKSVLRF